MSDNDNGLAEPDARGLGEALEQVAEFVEDRFFAQPGFIIGHPDQEPVPVVLRPGGGYDILPPSAFDLHNDGPRFRRGTARFTSLDSLIDHLNRFGDSDSAAFVSDDRTAPAVTAVLDYHRADYFAQQGDDETITDSRKRGAYRHGLHRGHFAFPLSDEWQAWTGKDGVAMSMAEFTVLIEDRIADFDDSDPAETLKRFVEINGGKGLIANYGRLVELTRGLRVHEKSTVQETVVMASGEGALRVEVEHEAAVGNTTIRIPTMVLLAIPVFRNGPLYQVPARLRYRKQGAGVVFWFDLYRTDQVFDHAFDEAVNRIRVETSAQVFRGSPE